MNANNNTISLKKQLMDDLNKLDRTDVQEILDFAEFILSRRYKRQKSFRDKDLVSERDPLLKLIGLADVQPFADRIDAELYG